MQAPLIIIGTGLAGYQLAKEFRKRDTHTPLQIFTADHGDFYSKPLLSTALTQQKSANALVMADANSMAQQLQAEIFTQSAVTRLDPEHHCIYNHEKAYPYRQLVLACGADVIKPQLQGDAEQAVVSVNHLHDYASFQQLLQGKEHITLLGAGLIGCEFANDLVNAGFKVHVISPAKTPLDLLLPEEIGLALKDALSAQGVHWHLGCLAEHINTKASQYQLQLSDGSSIDTDLVLSAIGLIPHTALAKTGHLHTNRGVLVNRYLETSAKDVYALGDCAEVEGHVLPFITPLLNGARALSKTLTGERTAVDYPAMPVIVKTPAHPLAICPPPRGLAGHWKIERDNNNLRALFYTNEHQLAGFVLTNDAVKERMQLAKQLPGLFTS